MWPINGDGRSYSAVGGTPYGSRTGLQTHQAVVSQCSPSLEIFAHGEVVKNLLDM
jgi:hypothetical protein